MVAALSDRVEVGTRSQLRLIFLELHLTNGTKKIEITQRHEPLKEIRIKHNYKLVLRALSLLLQANRALDLAQQAATTGAHVRTWNTTRPRRSTTRWARQGNRRGWVWQGGEDCTWGLREAAGIRRRRGAQSGGRGNGGRRERAVGRSGGVGNGRRERRRDLLATWGHPAALGKCPGGGGNGGWPARAGGSRRGSSPGGTDAGGAANRADRRCRAGRAQGNARRRCESRLPGMAGRSVASASWGVGEPLGRGGENRSLGNRSVVGRGRRERSGRVRGSSAVGGLRY